MARVWIVNPFDPLPGDPEQPGRYATLAWMLRDVGHQVVWWTSSFSHRFKRPVDRVPILQTCQREGIDVRFLEVPAYSHNVSYRRIHAHRVYARRFEQQAKEAAAPGVIIASNPPLESPVVAGRIAAARGAKLIVDVQDIWIDNFRQLMPTGIRWAWPLLLRPWWNANRRAYSMADAVVGVAGGYADEPLRYGRLDYRREVIPLGIDLAAFDSAVRRGRCMLGDKPTDEIWVAYSGSYSHAYDVLTIAEVARRVAWERSDIRLIFTGRGELEKRVREITQGLDRVTFLGFAPFDDWAATLVNCDIGWNAVKPEALVLMPNKVFYYWASGLAVLNSIPGECADWISRTGTGVSYSAGDVNAASAALLKLVCDRTRLARQREASRREAIERWDRRRLYQTYLDLVSELIACG